MSGSEQDGPSWEEAKTQWKRINDCLMADMPSLNATLLRVIPQNSGLPRFGESPYASFLRYLLALDDVCQQALYALERLPLFTSREECSNPWELRVKYYLYDLLSRVKTATDLVALMLNELFELGLSPEECSLEKGKVAGGLTSFSDEDSGIGAAAREVGATLDRARDDWIRAFYELRNLVIHRNGLDLGGARHPETGEYCSLVLAGGLLDVADDRRAVDQIVTRLDLLEDPLTRTSAVEPVNLCEQLWTRVAALVDSVLDQCELPIDRFVSAQQATLSGKP